MESLEVVDEGGSFRLPHPQVRAPSQVPAVSQPARGRPVCHLLRGAPRRRVHLLPPLPRPQPHRPDHGGQRDEAADEGKEPPEETAGSPLEEEGEESESSVPEEAATPPRPTRVTRRPSAWPSRGSGGNSQRPSEMQSVNMGNVPGSQQQNQKKKKQRRRKRK